jgi:hypothetical protein
LRLPNEERKSPENALRTQGGAAFTVSPAAERENSAARRKLL